MERIDECSMARTVLMARTGQTDVRLGGWREGGFEQHSDDCFVRC